MKSKVNKLQINMLGGFSLTYEDKTINDHDIRSRKSWTLLGYLITYRNKKITQSELIDLVYPEGKSDSPANALKTLIHRVRNLLDQLEFVDGKDMIRQTGGTYCWNTQLPIDIDVDQFEMLCKKANEENISDKDRLGFLLNAIDIYQGDFMAKWTMESWVVQLNTYYHSLYLNIARSAIEIFLANEAYEQIVQLCNQALAIDSYDEYLHYHLILSLAKMKNTQSALNQYKRMTAMFYREFGVTPSKELSSLYKEIIKDSENVEADLNIIKEDLREEEEDISGAYLCEYEVFKDIYRLEVRCSSRTGDPVYLCLITLSDKYGGTPTLKQLNAYINKLAKCIRYSLRRGDIYAKYSISQFIIMLPVTNYENGELVMNRICKRFRNENQYCPLVVDAVLQPLDILI